jgi:sugar (pentulose or hexulose) kinase
MDLLLGIDAGTTSLKASLFDPDGGCLAIARQEYQLDTPAVDRAELDPEIYWQACVSTVRKVIEGSGVDPRRVAALGVSSQGETLICVDPHGRPLYPALIWLDNRATRQAEALSAQFSTQVYQMTGIPEIIATWPACKIQWIRENEPGIFERVAKFLLVEDFLVHRLTGKFITNGSIACTSLYFNILHNAWWQPVLDAIGVSTRQLPELAPPGAIVGNLCPAATEQLGLPSSVKVAACGMDQCVGAIGAGNILPGNCSETTGGALTIQVGVSNPAIDQNKIIPVYFHSIPDQYLLVPVCPTAGMAFKWFRDVFGLPEMEQALKDDRDPYDLMTQLAESIPAGSDGLVLLPHLMGAYSPAANSAARGSFTGFTLTHTRGHFVRAVLEGVAFLLKRNLDVIQQAGLAIHEIRSTGGGARSALWNQIKANVCNLPVITLVNEDTALLGDAILAGVACGIFQSIHQAGHRMVDLKDKFLPTGEVDVYRKAYQRYCDLDQALDGYYKRNF